MVQGNGGKYLETPWNQINKHRSFIRVILIVPPVINVRVLKYYVVY